MCAKAAVTAEGSCAATACAALSNARPVSPPFWCSTNTAKMSPNNMPAAMSAMPPNNSNRLAPIAANAGVVVSVVVDVAICPDQLAEFRSAGAAEGGCPHTFLLVGSSGVRPGPAKFWHYVFGKHVLNFDALPVLQPTKIRDDRKLSDSGLRFHRSYLIDDFLGRADKADFLLDNVIVGQLRQRLECAAGIETVSFGAQLSFLLFTLYGFDW